MRPALLFLSALLPACASGFTVKDTTDRPAPAPGTFRAAVLHLGADFGIRETREKALEDVRRNSRETRRLIRLAKGRGANIVITPEYGNTGNRIQGPQRDWLGTRLPPAPCETPLFELELEGLQPYVAEYARLAAELRVWIVTNVFEIEGRGEGTRYYNCGIVLDDRGRVRARYRKINLWWPTEYSVDAGDSPTLFDSPFGRFGMLICSDALSPGLWSDLVDGGADFLIMQSHWIPSPYLGRFAMGLVAAHSERTVLWSNHPGLLAGGAGFIYPGLVNDDALSTFSGAGMVIADLPTGTSANRAPVAATAVAERDH